MCTTQRRSLHLPPALRKAWGWPWPWLSLWEKWLPDNRLRWSRTCSSRSQLRTSSYLPWWPVISYSQQFSTTVVFNKPQLPPITSLPAVLSFNQLQQTLLNTTKETTRRDCLAIIVSNEWQECINAVCTAINKNECLQENCTRTKKPCAAVL